MSVDLFKQFFSDFQQHYCNQVTSIEGEFQKKVNFLQDLKNEVLRKAEAVNKSCLDQKRLSSELEGH